MSEPVIYQLPTPWPATVGISPNFKAMVCGNNLSELTTPGFLNAVNLQSNPVSTTDIMQILYSFNPRTQVGSYGAFTVSIHDGIITLTPAAVPGEVVLPVNDGHFANFIGTTGAIGDRGLFPANFTYPLVPVVNDIIIPQDTFVPCFLGTDGTIGMQLNGSLYSFNGTVIAGNNATSVDGALVSSSGIPEGAVMALKCDGNPGGFNTTISDAPTLGQSTDYFLPDPEVSACTMAIFAANPSVITTGNVIVAGGMNGSLSDGGFTLGDVVSIDTVNQMQPGSGIYFDKTTGTEAGGTITLNSQAGVITTSSLTTIPGDEYAFLFTNSFIQSNSAIQLTVNGGGSDSSALVVCESITNGSAEIQVQNVGSAAFNGVWVIAFLIT